MDIQEMLQWTGDRVLAKTGKPLDSLQRAILEGNLQGKKYPKIANFALGDSVQIKNINVCGEHSNSENKKPIAP